MLLWRREDDNKDDNKEEEHGYAYCPLHLFAVIRTSHVGDAGESLPTNPCIRYFWSSRAPSLRSAHLSRRWIYLDTRVLGLGWLRLLLGPRDLGFGSTARPLLDSRLLELGQRQLY